MKVLASIKKMQYNDSIKYYFYPQYEIVEEDKLRRITERRIEFPNKGTCLIVSKEGDTNRTLETKVKIIENLIDTLIPIQIDTSRVTDTYREDEENSCMYNVVLQSIVPLDSNEIIEVIKIEGNINEIIENDNKRNIQVRKKPLNKKILLEIGEYVYGYFEYGVQSTNNEDIEDIEDSLVKKYTIRISANPLNRNTIKKYKKSDIKDSINTIFIDNDGVGREFIYNLKMIECINAEDTIDFIEDKPLVNLLRKIAEDSSKIKLTNEQLRRLKECLIEYEPIEFKESKISRLSNKILITQEHLDFKEALINEYFLTEEGNKEKKNYLDSNPDKLEKIIYEVEGTQKIHDKFEKEKQQKLEEVNKLDKQIEDKKIELEEIKIQKSTFIDKEIEIRKKEFSSLETKIEELQNKENVLLAKIQEYMKKSGKIDENLKLEDDKQYLDRYNNDLRRQIQTVQDELKSTVTNTKKTLADYLNNDIQRKIFEDILMQNNISDSRKKENEDISIIINRKQFDNPNDIIETVYETIVNKGKREFSREDIINLIISISQNFITVFAGEPGVGKTSLCELLGKSLGLYEKRFAKVAVERGWTSSKDLVGYYNPLTKLIEKTNIEMHRCLNTLNWEVNNETNELYFVLLDEANLSPIEHYWSSFMMLTDKHDRGAIQIGGDVEYKLSDGTRFLATINYDHTTENLSSRFLDRAWVILLDVPQQSSLIEPEEFESDIQDSLETIDFLSLKKFFTALACKEDDVLNPSTESVWLTIIDLLYQGRVYISARSRIAVLNYCRVAQKYMDIENNRYTPLDYAVAQKVLPMIDGYGEQYRDTLDKLLELFKNNNMDKCRKIIEKVIEVGDKEHGYYQYFCR